MNTLKRNIPNFITLSNLFCGLLSIIYAFNNQLTLAAIFIFLGIFLDFFDGFFARLLKIENNFGLQLDSMADLITSAVAPSIILFQLFCNNIPNHFIFNIYLPFPPIALTALIIPLFAAIRLSKFNININQKDSFIGLPTPMLALFIAAIPFIKELNENTIYNNVIFLCIISISLSLLMVSKIKMFSLKIQFQKKQIHKLNIIRLVLAGTSLLLLLLFNFAAIPFIVALYITLSIINTL
ncbi:MAG: CDP-diacylglycerol--serine O-phosphatidyltransferase [Flavobacteriales bacterium]|jgi:CDP-diacylglycerol---serine O-phosphatidyltransferase|nr:CDP-diacylglycerol--serine O-phosphatidyltransferase [Flavobacteriales bacterium]